MKSDDSRRHDQKTSCPAASTVSTGMSTRRCEAARRAITEGARHAAACPACAFFTTLVPARPACGCTTSCQDELQRAARTGTPFLDRFALAAPGYRDAQMPLRARDLATGADVVITDGGPGRRTRCGAVVVARDFAAPHNRSMVDGGELDSQLRALVAAGNVARAVELMQEAWSHDVERYVRYRRNARARLAIEDICQNVWASVHRGLPAFRFEAPTRAWLFGIAARRLIDVARQGPVDDELDSVQMGAIADSLTGPLSRLLRDERAAAVRAVLASCDPADATLLQLRFGFDLSLAEIAYLQAEEADRPPEDPNTIAKRIGRLLVKLGKQLARDELFRSRAR
jgi:RNA polymerase sigma factor (sigma-70 family)